MKRYFTKFKSPAITLPAILLSAILVSVLLTSLPARAKVKPEPALSAALDWLKLIDGGKYKDSWKQAGSLFKNAIGDTRWAASLTGVRKPLGAVKKREAAKINKAKTLPGVPDGDYRVILFDTTFAKKARARETVTMMLEKDGKWRSVGYFIR